MLNDPPKPEELSAAIQVARLHLDDIDRELPGLGKAKSLVGVAGTITTIAAVEIGLDPYDSEVIDGFRLTRQAAEDVLGLWQPNHSLTVNTTPVLNQHAQM